MARIFIVDGITYPDPGPEMTPDQFKELMAGFLPELATAEMTEEKQGEEPFTVSRNALESRARLWATLPKS